MKSKRRNDTYLCLKNNTKRSIIHVSCLGIGPRKPSCSLQIPTSKRITFKLKAVIRTSTTPQITPKTTFFTVNSIPGIKWNLIYHCTLTMHDPYRREVRTHRGYFRTTQAGYKVVVEWERDCEEQIGKMNHPGYEPLSGKKNHEDAHSEENEDLKHKQTTISKHQN